jgi:hypothetical protein
LPLDYRVSILRDRRHRGRVWMICHLDYLLVQDRSSIGTGFPIASRRR